MSYANRVFLPIPKASRPNSGTKPLERDVQKQILDWLKWNRYFAWRSNTGAARYPNRGGGSRLVRFGTSGVPDIIAIRDGRFIGIEVKRPGGKLSPAQSTFRDALLRAGGIYILAASAREVETQLSQVGWRS